MPDPLKYTPSYDFSNFQANSPSAPLPGDRIDIEFGEIQRAVLETILALADIRRSDGALQNGIVTSDALAPNIVDQIVEGTITLITNAAAAAAASEENAGLSEDNAAASETAAGFSAAAAAASEEAVLAVEDNLPDWKGAWVTGTVYDTGDLVRQEGASYICVIAHTAAAFSTDLSAMRWELFAAKGAPGAGTGDLLASNNLSDVASVATARANLGVPATGTVLLKADNLAGLSNTATAQSNLGLPSGTTGRAVLAAATQAVGRTALGLGSAATRTAENTLTNGSNLPDGAAVKAYVDGVKSLASSNGYAKLPGGLILQWGQTTVLADTDASITWATPFLSAPMQAIACLGGAFGVTTDAGCAIYNLSTTGATVRNGVGLPIAIRYFAIGV